MPNELKIRIAIQKYVLEHGTNEVKTTDEIRIITGVSGMQPSDYSYNCYNSGLGDFTNPKLFVKEAHGRYRIIGTDSDYSGTVIWKHDDGKETIYGEYKGGEFFKAN